MRMLLDTHIALWALVDDPKLPKKARELIADSANDVVVSVATVWEIAIKHALSRNKRNAIPISGTEAVAMFRMAGYQLLGISSAHAASVESLPPIHADPFDRMLVAQALSEPLQLITSDPVVARYSDAVIHV
ncbi:MAG: type II toxin-antitoxin system VapC family toxin [Clostridia bacterium]|nr:type II toxin-antitoxin system VapC family toxin [Deltaproteobacteria bacterium]